ncbi:HAD family phosphatase [Nonomuraea turkmeniaca]|uniref:HAD family phosphatase n=1 Tax=Nonomuraea turkmeniaca TaxID=103838 RepID=A0A5S4EX47_9ACTN|nr:HAD family phosphatase [Nonomuraea turkmeniaca]TMR08177.1 HAD family phosphatase [Nonomuraea turkmeniaca]
MRHHLAERGTRPLTAGIVFDCDGVLVDTEGAWSLAYEVLFTRYGVPLTVAARRSLAGLNLVQLSNQLADMLGPAVMPEQVGREAYALMRQHQAETKPLPGAVELVDRLAGCVPLAVASNAPAHVVITNLEKSFDLAAFTVIVGSDVVAAPKPAPDVYIAACAAMNVPPRRTWALEDSAAGASAALSAGLGVVGVKDPSEDSIPCHVRHPHLADPRLWQSLMTLPFA